MTDMTGSGDGRAPGGGTAPNPAPVILLVDDDPINLRILYAALEKEGYRLLAARSGEEALQVAGRGAPALVLLDIQMPGIDGYEACRRLKGDPRTGDSAVIFLTALRDTPEKVKGLALGAVDFITKPFEAEEVRARVARQLSQQQDRLRLREENRRLSERLQGGADGADGGGGGDAALDAAAVADLIRAGESGRVEFKSTLRWNLEYGRRDREIEKAWLKTVVAFLNTDGGTLLVGVQDDGRVLGTAPDRFESLDRYLLHVSNLIQDYIGLSCSACIRYGLAAVGGDHVLVVRCRPCPQPVFLRVNREEEFYVRVGPGTRRLSPSEVLAYVTQRRPGVLPAD